MVEHSPITPAFVDKYVRDKGERILHARGIYELGSYGWRGPDDFDSETIGHAMWQTDSLYFHFLEAHFSATHANGPAPRVLEPWEQFLVQSGGDFEGLMQAAWLSIGLTLFHRQTTERDHYGENSFFQVHLISSMILLSTAADRLRDLFVAAVFQINTDQYENARAEADGLKGRKERKATWYNGPFYEAAQFAVAAAHAKEAFSALPSMADRMFKLRSLRNQVIHTVATELGRQQRELAEKTEPDVVAEEYFYENVRNWQEQSDAEYLARVEEDVTRLIDWYKLLIEMSNEVFIVENNLRRHGYRA
jgi:hypothetical protein